MESDTVYVVNPNSNPNVTRAIDAALAPLRTGGGPRISCVTVDDGPPAIETQDDADEAIAPLLRRARALEADAGAFVIACFSDPGIHELRGQSTRPVFGIGESGVLTAMALGRRIGIMAILEASVPRHQRYFAALGLTSRIVAELPVGLGVAELADEPRALARLVDVGRTLRDVHEADVLVLGCAGMASFRRAVEDALETPVLDPTQSAVAMALGRLSSSRLFEDEQPVTRNRARTSLGRAAPRRRSL
jgi:Asp/Glu/hydantoin racemase